MFNLAMSHPAQQIVDQELIDLLNECSQRVERLTRQIQELLPHWHMFPVVQSIQALRGVSMIVATTTIAEIGNLYRFDHPKELMSYIGLVPSEHSSGQKTRRGGIKKTGNGRVRRILIEAAWSYRLPAQVSETLYVRQKNLPQDICAIGWKAQLRLCTRYKRLMTKASHRS